MTKPRKRLKVVGFTLLLLLSALFPAAAILDVARVFAGYPYTDDDPGAISPYGFNHRSSMDYVAWHLNNTGITLYGRKFVNNWDGGSDQDHWGDPSNWPRFATRLGFTVDQKPAVGAIAQWTVRYPGSPDDRGHVAVVTRVDPAGTIDIDEFDFKSVGNGFTANTFGRRSGVGPADNYIHLERALPGGVWTPRTTRTGMIDDTVTVVVEVKDNNNGGLDYAVIAANHRLGDGRWTGWRPIKKELYDGAPRGTITITYTIPADAACLRLSFDVFSRNRSSDGSQSRQLAPHGTRRYHRSGHDCQT